MWVWSLGWEGPLEKERATRSTILAWRSPWTEVGYSSWGHKESNVTEHACTHTAPAKKRRESIPRFPPWAPFLCFPSSSQWPCAGSLSQAGMGVWDHPPPRAFWCFLVENQDPWGNCPQFGPAPPGRVTFFSLRQTAPLTSRSVQAEVSAGGRWFLGLQRLSVYLKHGF